MKGTLSQNEKEGYLLPESELQSLLPELASLQTDYQSLQIRICPHHAPHTNARVARSMRAVLSA